MSSPYEQFNEDFGGFLKEMLKSAQTQKNVFYHAGRQMGKTNYNMQTFKWKMQQEINNSQRKPKMWQPITSLEACKRVQNNLRMYSILGGKFTRISAEYSTHAGAIKNMQSPENMPKCVSLHDVETILLEVGRHYTAVYRAKQKLYVKVVLVFNPTQGVVEIYAIQPGHQKERCYIPKLE